MQTLYERLANYWDDGHISKALPEYIIENLNLNFHLRTYQQQALAFLFYYLNDYAKRIKPSQLLFHMATGAGKTLVMAAAILHLYKRGYRNFLFFVNSTNIIEKTRDNFLNASSSKYLFAQKVKFGAKVVYVREVQNFQSTHSDDINILFTTIQGLHSRINTPRENALTYEDFADQNIVLISDEAHHINALTKTRRELSHDEMLEFDTWEATVQNIFSASPENILLEFTATMELEHPAIQQKYQDKILYQYPLTKFREDGFSKEVKVLEADLEPIKRALQAVILSQYRRKVAEKNGVPLKPVLLMKSRTIKESEAFEEQFRTTIQKLNSSYLAALKKAARGIIEKAFAYFEAQNISLENLAAELRQEFDENRTLVVNSKEDSEKKQLLVNSLEDKGNEIRVVFAVNMLNEGWDVLNLFDIVRLYDTRDAKQGVPGKTTISEAQLIGRGARYFPFQSDSSQIRDKRKFDYDLDNEMRVLEELYYHSAHNPRYIDELHKALIQTGIVAPRIRTVTVRVKDAFKATDFWKNGVIFANKRIRNKREGILGFDNLTISRRLSHKMKTGFAHEALLLEDQTVHSFESSSWELNLGKLGENVIRTALQRLEFYQFANLKQYFPHLKSIHEFITSADYLGGVVIELIDTAKQTRHISQADKLHIAITALEKIEPEIKAATSDYEGTKVFEPMEIRCCVRDKTLQITVNENGSQERGKGMRETTNSRLYLDLRDKAWYVYDENYGTSEEKYLVRFINDVYDKLVKRHSDIYLIRNEKLFQIYGFSDGAAIEPDFVLLLKEKKSNKSLIYQLFIEPKGEHLLEDDSWKEKFLKEIDRIAVIYQNDDFKLWGMPFYNENRRKADFKKEFERFF